MNRIILTNKNNWFDLDTSTQIIESLINNVISKVTQDRWQHECLFLTSKNNWILKHWSDYDGTLSYELITQQQATAWLMVNGYDPSVYGLLSFVLASQI